MTVGSFIRFAWETFKKRPLFFIFAPLLFSILYSIIGGMIGSIVGSVIGGSESLTDFITSVIKMVVNVFYWLGFGAMLLKAHDAAEAVELKDLWHPHGFWRYLGASVLMMVTIIAGLMLFIVPGIVALLAFMFVPYLVIEKGLGPIDAMKESARITKGHRLRLFALLGANMLLILLGVLCFLVGVLVTGVIGAIAVVHAYKVMSADASQALPTRQPLTRGEKGFVAAAIILPIILVLGGLSSVAFLGLEQARMDAQNPVAVPQNTQ